MIFPTVRLRRLRQNAFIRDLIREHDINSHDLVAPLFFNANLKEKKPIVSLPNHFQLSLSDLANEISHLVNLNLKAVILFGIPAYKDARGSSAVSTDGIIQTVIAKIKALAPHLIVITDLCCCEYTDHGHCGVLNHKGDVDNDETLGLLTEQAVSHAKAGADIIAPSGMMDGAVQVIRKALDQAGYQQVLILSYAVKYASCFYGPFREAAESTPAFGDRRSYQMDPANSAEALKEAELDIAEGADMLMVKPAQNYLDIIFRLKNAFPSTPLSAYQVSGEYAMIKAAAANGWIDGEKAMLESLLAIKRAGADFIISYFAAEFARYVKG